MTFGLSDLVVLLFLSFLFDSVTVDSDIEADVVVEATAGLTATLRVEYRLEGGAAGAVDVVDFKFEKSIGLSEVGELIRTLTGSDLITPLSMFMLFDNEVFEGIIDYINGNL